MDFLYIHVCSPSSEKRFLSVCVFKETNTWIEQASVKGAYSVMHATPVGWLKTPHFVWHQWIQLNAKNVQQFIDSRILDSFFVDNIIAAWF